MSCLVRMEMETRVEGKNISFNLWDVVKVVSLLAGVIFAVASINTRLDIMDTRLKNIEDQNNTWKAHEVRISLNEEQIKVLKETQIEIKNLLERKPMAKKGGKKKGGC